MTTDDWIPVGERLPEESGAYIVFLDGEVTRGEFRARTKGWAESWHSSQTRNVTHWMPLPPPPTDQRPDLWIVQVEGCDGDLFTVSELGLRSDGMTREQAESVVARLRDGTARIAPAGSLSGGPTPPPRS